MKILVTGGAGFIGSHVADLLIKNNHQVAIIDDLSNGKIENINKNAVFYKEDLSNHSKIKDIFEKEKPEIIYHLAAQMNVRKSLENPIEDAKSNILNTLNILELAVKNKIKHFIFSSTGSVYENNIPSAEQNAEKPISPYSCSKLAIEKYLHFYKEVYGLKYTILRYSNVYGPRQNAKGEAGVVSIFIKNMLENKQPVIYGGLQTRDFVYVEDIARANLLALQDSKSDIYNVSTAINTDIIEIFNKINSFFNHKFSAEYKDRITGEQMHSCLKYDKIKKELCWFPETSLKEGLQKTYLWFSKNKY